MGLHSHCAVEQWKSLDAKNNDNGTWKTAGDKGNVFNTL